MWKEKGRAAIYEMAGIYLLVKAYDLFLNRAESHGNEYLAVFIFIFIFTVVGIGLIVFGTYIMIKKKKTVEQDIPNTTD